MSNIVVQTAPVVQCVPPPPHPGAKYVQVYKNLGVNGFYLRNVCYSVDFTNNKIKKNN